MTSGIPSYFYAYFMLVFIFIIMHLHAHGFLAVIRKSETVMFQIESSPQILSYACHSLFYVDRLA